MIDLFLDTEFNSFGGELISIALVPLDTGTFNSFYEVVGAPARPHPWVALNVLPKLGKQAVGLEEVRFRLQRYLGQIPGAVRVYADWPEDHAHLMMLLCSEGGMSLNKEITCVLARPPIDPTPENPHNALSDAKALREAWV